MVIYIYYYLTILKNNNYVLYNKIIVDQIRIKTVNVNFKLYSKYSLSTYYISVINFIP